MTTTVLTIAPLGDADMANRCGGWAKRAGRTPIKVPSTANLSPKAIPDAAAALDKMIAETLAQTLGEVVGFAHSQGCQAVGEWLAKYANKPGAPDPARVSFVLTGNLERKYYGYAARKPAWIPAGNIRGLTPDETPYRVLDIGRKGDLWANYPGGVRPILGLLVNPAHLNYSRVDPDNLKPISSKQVGNTTYYVVP